MAIKIKPEVIINERAIQNDLKKFAKVCAETVAWEAQSMLMKFAEEQMWGYYMEYEPYDYFRTDAMLDYSYQPLFIKNGDSYEGGIWINSSFTNHKPKGRTFTEEDLYENVWVRGSHGLEMVGYKSGWQDTRHLQEILGEPNRLEKVKKKAYSKQTKNQLLAKGMRKAKAQTYSILNFK